MQGNTTHRGDNGLFRSALLLSGFFEHSEDTIFNDKSKNFRRLKLWFADRVFNAPQEQQQALEKLLREAFGDRILCMYFQPSYSRWSQYKSLCIRLKD
jgi:hypothetical protein